MNLINNYRPNLTPNLILIDLQKKAKEISPQAANLACSTLYNNGNLSYTVTALAVQIFKAPWGRCLLAADAKLTQALNQIYPSYDSKKSLVRNLTIMSLYLGVPFTMGYKACHMTGYDIGLEQWFFSQVIGSTVQIYVKALQENLRKETEIQPVKA